MIHVNRGRVGARTTAVTEAVGSDGSVTRALNLIWHVAETANIADGSLIRQYLAECEAAVPESENFSSLFTSGAQDAMFAICSIFDFMRTCHWTNW
jgi:hypothetical protein